MWLDRLSGQSTPAQSSTPARAYSPAPRKPSHLAVHQSSLASRSSTSLSTVLDPNHNISTSSLPSPTRAVNGSALRHEQKPPPDVPDPLQVLESILGTHSDDTATDRPHKQLHFDIAEIGESIAFEELSLENFVKKNVPAGPKGGASITTARDNKQKFEDFHESVAECDAVLQSVETYLTNFKAELGQVSAEIENLQARSAQLNARLDNRRKVEKLLGPAVEEFTLSPVTVRAISEGPIDDNFVKALNEVQARSVAITEKSATNETSKALEDVRPLLDDLKVKAIERIRDYIVSQIKALRSPNINAQVIQHQYFLRFKDLYTFLARNHAALAEEIAQAYINTMKWYYSSNFARYQQALQKLHIHTLDQNDLLGTDPSAARRNAKAPQRDAVGLGRRMDILRTKNDAALPSYLAEDSKTYNYLEISFRNFNQALIDNVCAEYSMITEFFSTNSYHQVSRKVSEVFDSTFVLGHNHTKQLVEGTTDCLGILLCVRLNQHFAFELQRRKVPVADSYINYTNILLWPRFQKAMDQHTESIKRVPTGVGRGAAAAFSLVGGNDASKASAAPHAITQRFGQFLHGILALSAEAGDDEPLSNSLGRLRTEYEALMMKLSKAAGDASKRSRFLYNNYSLVSTIISDTQGRLAEEQKEHFGTLVEDLKGK